MPAGPAQIGISKHWIVKATAETVELEVIESSCWLSVDANTKLMVRVMDWQVALPAQVALIR